MRITKVLTYICEECFTTNNYKINLDIPQIHHKEDLTTLGDIYLDPKYLCPICKKHTWHFSVDRDVAGLVSIINRLGYETDFSCQGHPKMVKIPEEDRDDKKECILDCFYLNFSHPYISIKINDKPMSKELVEIFARNGWNDISIGDIDEFNYHFTYDINNEQSEYSRLLSDMEASLIDENPDDELTLQTLEQNIPIKNEEIIKRLQYQKRISFTMTRYNIGCHLLDAFPDPSKFDEITCEMLDDDLELFFAKTESNIEKEIHDAFYKELKSRMNQI